jgi:hypothetical protein
MNSKGQINNLEIQIKSINNTLLNKIDTLERRRVVLELQNNDLEEKVQRLIKYITILSATYQIKKSDTGENIIF